MTKKQLNKKVLKMFKELNELVNNESYLKDFADSEVDGKLIDAKYYLDEALELIKEDD